MSSTKKSRNHSYGRHTRKVEKRPIRYEVLRELSGDDFPYDELGDDFLSEHPGPMMSLEQKEPDDVVDLSALFHEPPPKSKRQLKREVKEARLARLEQSKRRWTHGKPEKMEQHYVDEFERHLANFFRTGYERYMNEGNPASDQEIITYYRSLIKKYKFLTTGGFLLKGMGLSVEGRSKESIDIDIILPYQTPIDHPEFYDHMAKLFHCDKKEDGTFLRERYIGRMVGGKPNLFMQQGVASVTKNIRHMNGKRGEMDLVRAQKGLSPESKIRSFDISLCMNWYDHHGNIWSLDKDAITDPEHHAGWVTPREAGFINGYGDKRSPRTETRILKYLLRGYRLQYVDTKEGWVHELKTQRFPNAIMRLNEDQRIRYYKEHMNTLTNNMRRELTTYEEQEAKVGENGIHLSGKTIRKLSGPVSCFYLKPTNNRLWESYHKEGVDLPLILLFGDIHYSNKGRCSPCDTKTAFSECYGIDEKPFYRLFDQLAEKTPVDFFLETSEKKDEWKIINKNTFPIREIEKLSRSGNVARRSHPPQSDNHLNRDPLIPTMRWHYSDARHMGKGIEREISEHFGDYLTYAIRACSNGTSLPPVPPMRKEVRELLRSVMLILMEGQKGKANLSMNIEVEDFADANQLIHAQLAGDFADKSVIFKQYKKSSLSKLFPYEALVALQTDTLMRDSIHTDLKKRIKLLRSAARFNDPDYLEVKALLMSILDDNPSPVLPANCMQNEWFNNYLFSVKGLFMLFFSHLMDFYYLCRMLKEPVGSATSTLAVAYMGNYHINNLVAMLTSPLLFGYSVVYKKQADKGYSDAVPDLRCITFQEPIYLERDVMELHERRFSDRPNALASYQDVLMSEKRGRAGHPVTLKKKNNGNEKRNNHSVRRKRNNEKKE